MLLTETFSYQIGTIKTKNGNNMRVAYIDAHRSQDTYGIRKQIQSYGAKWEPNGKWWYWPLGNNPEEVIRTQVRPCIEYLTKIEDTGGGPRRDIEVIINKLIAKLETSSMPNVKGGSSKEDILASLERFKEDLVKITSDEEFKKMMEPIIKFRSANNYQYSLLNTLLILVQDPQATLVKSGGAWRDYYQRTIKPGAKPIMMWIPKGKRAYTDEEREQVITSYLKKKKVKAITDLSVPDKEALDKKLGKTIPESFDLAPYWYDYRFTEQKPNTEDILGNPGDDVQWFDDSGDETPELVKKIDAALAVIEEEGITLSFVDKIGSGEARGVSKSGSIEILQNQPKNAGMLNTIIHEFAHEILHQSYLKSKNDEMKDYFVGTSEGRGKVEQQAELCAWIVMRSFGYDMKTNINYVGIWGLNQDNAVRVFDSVSKVATLITQKINRKEQGVTMEESKNYLQENNIPSGEEIAKLVGCGDVYKRAKKHLMRQQPTVENIVRINQTELSEIIKETVTKILKESSQEQKIKKFRTKSGAPVEVVINLSDDGEGDFEYSIDGGNIDYVSGYLRVEDNEVVDFDGCYDLPKAVKLTLKEMGISCDW
jgi:hypothetical protein